MNYSTFDFAYGLHVSMKHHLFAALLLITGVILHAETTHSDTLSGSDTYCAFSIQLQGSPYREQYIARLAMDLGTMLASNTPDESTVRSDAPAFLTQLLGSAGTGTPDAVADTFSKDCLACHDGSAASDINFNFTNAPGTARQQKYAGGKDHPNGMDYRSYVAMGQGKFKPVSMFNSAMKFVNGRVGCLTCHNPLNPEKGHLVMSDFKSALCLTCHNL